jgi:hypothetical protein
MSSKFNILSKFFGSLSTPEDQARQEKKAELVHQLAQLHIQQSNLLLHKPFYEVDMQEYDRLGELIQNKKKEREELEK